MLSCYFYVYPLNLTEGKSKTKSLCLKHDGTNIYYSSVHTSNMESTPAGCRFYCYWMFGIISIFQVQFLPLPTKATPRPPLAKRTKIATVKIRKVN